jgi:hypothetical protein
MDELFARVGGRVQGVQRVIRVAQRRRIEGISGRELNWERWHVTGSAGLGLAPPSVCIDLFLSLTTA